MSATDVVFYWVLFGGLENSNYYCSVELLSYFQNIINGLIH